MTVVNARTIIEPDASAFAARCPDHDAACRYRFCGYLPNDLRPCQQRTRVLKRGERLISEHGGCLMFWVVIEGAAAVCASLADGRRQIIELDLPGDLICAMSATVGTSGWVEALDDCRVCELDLTDDADRLRGDLGFTREMFHHVHDRLARSAVHQIALGRLDSMERICLFLADIAKRTGTRNGVGLRVHLPMSRVDIADYLGLNTETVSRLLGRVKKQKLAFFLTPTEMVVPDIARLESMAPVAWRR